MTFCSVNSNLDIWSRQESSGSLWLLWYSSGGHEWGYWAHLWLLSGGHLEMRFCRKLTYAGSHPQDQGDFWDVNCFRVPWPILPLLFSTFSFCFHLFLFLLFPSSFRDIYKYTLTPQFLTQALSLLTFAVCEDKRFSWPLQSPRGGHGPVFVESSTLMKCR